MILLVLGAIAWACIGMALATHTHDDVKVAFESLPQKTVSVELLMKMHYLLSVIIWPVLLANMIYDKLTEPKDETD